MESSVVRPVFSDFKGKALKKQTKEPHNHIQLRALF